MNLSQISSANHLNETGFPGSENTGFTTGKNTDASQKSDFPIPSTVKVKTLTNEDPKELKRRILMEAASEAGLDGTKHQAEFVEKYTDRNIFFKNEADDPSKNDDRMIRSKDLVSGRINYELSPDKEMVDLRRLQIERLAEGRELANGKTYEKSAKGESFTKSAYGRTPQTVAAYEKQKAREMHELYEQARLINATFGTPSKLNEIKQAWVAVGRRCFGSG